MSLAVLAALLVSILMAAGGEYIALLERAIKPSTSEFTTLKIGLLVAFAACFGLLAEKFYFRSFAVITGLFLAIWFGISTAANKFFGLDLLFFPIFLVSLISLVAIQIKNYGQNNAKLDKRLAALKSNGYLLEDDDADSRVESGLKLLEAILPLSEIIVFQYEPDGHLVPVGRSRKTGENSDPSARQTSWHKTVELCESALKERKTVVEVGDKSSGAAKVALPLVTDNVLVGGLFVSIRQDFESDDTCLLEAFSAQLARNFQRKLLGSKNLSNSWWGTVLSVQSQENRLNTLSLINGAIKELSFGVAATSCLKEAHAIAYLDGKIAYVNTRMRELAKLEGEDIREINLFDLLGRFETDVFNEPGLAIRKVLQTGGSFQQELHFPEAEMSLDMEITLVKTAKNAISDLSADVTKKPACFLITFRNITARKENEKLRSDMVNLMSHELRTPITSIQGFAEMLLLDESIPEDSREYLSIIAKESQRASNLLTNFLSVAKLQQSDKQEFHKSPVRINKVVEDVVGNFQGTAKKKRIRLVEKHGERIPPIAADRGLLTKAISHLIDNAVKYSPERSSVLISTILESDFLRVEVEDRGYGIPPAEQEKIWQKFYRVARDGQDKEDESTGLGLSLVKEIVERHSGTVGVESKLGRGSKFSLRIPRI